MKTLQERKQQLLTLRNDYTQRIEAIQVDSHHKEKPVEKDFAEQATQSENDDVLAALDDEAQHMVMLIDASLSRIKKGNYGHCSECGLEIPSPRLDAIPFAHLCIECAEDPTLLTTP